MKAPLTFLLFAAALAAQTCVEVAGDRILAGELAETVPAFRNVPADQVLGFAPVAGARRVFYAAELARLSGQAVSEDVCVTRKSRSLNIGEIEAAMRQAFADPAVSISVLDYLRAPVPLGPIEFPLSGLTGGDTRDPSAGIWRGTVRVSDGRSVSVWAKARVVKRVRAVKALRDIAAGEVLDAAALTVTDVEWPGRKEAPPSGMENLAGRQAVRAIANGTVVTPGLLRASPAVRRGNTVQVAVRTGGAVLSFEAKAESTARAGDRVLVRGPFQNQLLPALVRADGTLEIDTNRVANVHSTTHPDRTDVAPGVRDRVAEAEIGRAGNER